MLMKCFHPWWMWVSSYWQQCFSSHSWRKCTEWCFGSVNTVILNYQSIDEKQLCYLMSLPSVRLAFISRHHQDNALMNHLSYSITVSYKGYLIRDGHQVSHHLHCKDQQSAELPANTSQSTVSATRCPQACWESLVRPNKSSSNIYWQPHNHNYKTISDG